MLFTDFLRMFFALALTLGLLGLVVVGLRRFGPETLKRLQGTRVDRRLAVVESLVLDPLTAAFCWSGSTPRNG